MKILPADMDARLVAALRTIGGLVIVAVISGLEKVLADPSWASYSWVPIALALLRIAEGFFDHSDPQRPG